jgi:hypothetical protein
MESYNKREGHRRYMVNISATKGRGPCMSRLAFYDTNIIVMRG